MADVETAEQELDVPLSCLIKSTVIALWSIGSIGYTLRNADNDKENKRGQYQHIVAWDSLGRVNGAGGLIVPTSSYPDCFQELYPCRGFGDIEPQIERVHPLLTV